MELSVSYSGQGTFFELPQGFAVQSVTVNGSPVGFTTGPSGITLSSVPALRAVVEIEYTLPSNASQAAGGVVSTLVSGRWVRPPSLFRLRLSGTGTVVIDARNGLEEVTLNAATFSASGASNQIEFPFLGLDAVDMRATFPSTLSVEVL